MIKDLFLVLLTSLILVLFVLIGVAFFTLLERKVLGYIHIRKGPSKVGIFGVFQPFSDAIKLFSKEQSFPLVSNLVVFYLSPVVNFFFSLLLWMSIPFLSINLNFSYSILFFLCISSLGVYTIMLAGWSSNSNYALLGSLRSVAQLISYEVSLILILLSFMFMISSFNLLIMIKYQQIIWFVFLLFNLGLMMMVSLLAETNRTPFDFAEGESELVSGFNVEYSSGGFAMIFLAEYSSIMFMSMVSVFILMGSTLSVIFFVKVMVMVFWWIWVRGTLPRFRYDKLMYMVWKNYLPVSLSMFIFYMSISMMVFILNT
uniref:NADH-ubiquinone oxidoreductase chain 1 n=1 Tax=Curculionoidea sp. 1 KM-2017 TaxID=2219392 RepID=A0A346RI13_9CUCU|nr:NADH dehydrogenase subunit 1 [Curculionoidea sp. 1 KM-2017]